MAGRFEGKQALVLGVANQRSIAWAIAKRLADEGASVAFTYQGERIEKNVRDLAGSVDSPLVTECDVRSDDDLARVFSEVGDVADLPFAPDLPGHPLELLGPSREEHAVPPLRGELASDRLADAGRGSGDHCDTLSGHGARH